MNSSKLGGRYQPIREIGAGGMGRVLQAVDVETGRAVAAKIMQVDGNNALETLLRFQQEGAVLSTLKHPNIVQVHGTFLEGETSCIIMELLEGHSLGQMLRVEHLSLTRVKKLLLQVVSALDYAHHRGIVHRDIEPDNIMVVGDDLVKVTDFGIARILRTGTTLNTAIGTSIGTPLYMSPEQIEGQKVDGRSDIYSLGAVLYQMVAGHPPFEGEDPLTVAFKHVHKAPEPPSHINVELPPEWEDLILRMLAKNPSDRYQSATDLEEAISGLTTDVSEQGLDAPDKGLAFPPALDSPDAPETGPRRPRVDNGDSSGSAQHDLPGHAKSIGPAPVAASAERVTLNRPPASDVSEPSQGSASPVARASTQGRIVDVSLTKTMGAVPSGSVAAGAIVAPRAKETRDDAAQPRQPVSAVEASRPVRGVVGRPVSIALAAVVLLAAVGGGFFALNRGSGVSSKPPLPVATALRWTCAHSGNACVSGQFVKLHWGSVSGASLYQLQLATRSSDPSDAVVFRHPSRTLSLKATSYRLKGIDGFQFYYWRVRALAHGRWGPFSPSRHFAVAKPKIETPRPLAPLGTIVTKSKVARLCWTPVREATDYRLRLDSGVAIVRRATCAVVPAHYGGHLWSVAAQVLGVRKYTGHYSRPTRFSLRAPVVHRKSLPRAKPKSAPHPSVATTPQNPVPQQPVPQPVPQQPVPQQPVPQPVPQQPVPQQPAPQQPVPQQPAPQQPAPQQPAPQPKKCTGTAVFCG
ncbi:MAG: protein kinase domain-containing protein [Chloroflexota bacterium]